MEYINLIKPGKMQYYLDLLVVKSGREAKFNYAH